MRRRGTRELRAGAARLAAERGLRLAAAGSHPISRPEDEAIADEPRYAEFVAYAGVSARRQGVSGLHVHVGMPSAEACFHALEGVLPWLPVVLALSRELAVLRRRGDRDAVEPRGGARRSFPAAARRPRSPRTRSGRRSSTASPGSGSAPTTRASGGTSGPHPKFGTLEIRMPDQPTALAVTVGLVAILRGPVPSRARPARALRSIPRRAASTSRTAGQPRASAFERRALPSRTARARRAPRSLRPRSPATGSTRRGPRPIANSRSAARTGSRLSARTSSSER